MSATTMNPTASRFRPRQLTVPGVVWWLDWVPLVVLLLSITFLQGYALTFWSDLLGHPGWAVSAGLELLHLWFWYRAATTVRLARAGWSLLAIVATALLLASVLHEVTRPLLHESARVDAALQERLALESEARVMEANLDAYRDMAANQGRRGWQDDLRRDTLRLQEISSRLAAIASESTASARRPWLYYVTQSGVIAVAVLFQLAAVLAIWTLSARKRSPPESFRPAPKQISKPEIISESVSSISKDISKLSETFHAAEMPSKRNPYRELWVHIEAHARNNSARLANGGGRVSQAALAKDLGIGAPDLSGIKLLAQAQPVPRNPSRESVEILAKRFGVEMPK